MSVTDIIVILAVVTTIAVLLIRRGGSLHVTTIEHRREDVDKPDDER
jgi:hypothetical protein